MYSGRKRCSRSTWLALAGLAAMALISGCAEEEPGSGTAAPDSGESRADQGAEVRLEVSADKTHAVQPGDELTVAVQSASGSGAAPAGTARYRAYLDDADGDDYLAASSAPTFKVRIPENVTDGSHELRVVLYDGDTLTNPPTAGSVWLIVYRLD